MLHYAKPGQDVSRSREGFSAADLPLPAKNMNVADIFLTSRYPASGSAMNTTSEMVVLIREGEVIFHCEGEEVLLSEGASILVEPNRPYHWLPRPMARLYTVSSPPWAPEQHKDA